MKNKVLFLVTIFLLLFLVTGCGKSDAVKFKEEYESLNGVENAKSISIMKDNNIKYISLDEAKEILDSKTGVIYFGTPSCAWSRNAVPVMLDAMQEAKLDTIYYVNVRPDNKKENDIRDEYTLDSRGKAKKTKDASESYYNILLSLANNLKEYVLTSDAGKKVSTGEKRLNTPTVVAVKNGVVIGFHEGTLNSNLLDKDGNLTDLTADQEKELKSIYVKIFEKYKDENCTDENC
jgi:glutaredoxin-related protein